MCWSAQVPPSPGRRQRAQGTKPLLKRIMGSSKSISLGVLEETVCESWVSQLVSRTSQSKFHFLIHVCSKKHIIMWQCCFWMKIYLFSNSIIETTGKYNSVHSRIFKAISKQVVINIVNSEYSGTERNFGTVILSDNAPDSEGCYSLYDHGIIIILW